MWERKVPVDRACARKVKVRFIKPASVEPDPKDPDVLDEKYLEFAAKLRLRGKPPSTRTIEALIAQKKITDRYGEEKYGIVRAMAWSAGEEDFIHPELARRLERAGLCTAVIP